MVSCHWSLYKAQWQLTMALQVTVEDMFYGYPSLSGLSPLGLTAEPPKNAKNGIYLPNFLRPNPNLNLAEP
jgi:hypothetical protein